MNYKNLYRRLKQIENQTKGQEVTIRFTDDSELTVSKRELRDLWFNISRIHENRLYQHMKAKYDEGYPDTSGLIYNMIAYDKNELEGLWDEH